AYQLVTVHVRHADVGDDQVRGGFEHMPPRDDRVFRSHHVVARVRQVQLQQLEHALVVVYDEDSGPGLGATARHGSIKSRTLKARKTLKWPRRTLSRRPMKRIFYGWYMVAAGCGLQFLQSSLLMQSFGAYVAVLRDDRGWSKTALSGAAALHQMEAAILGPVLGWIIDRFGPQGLIRIGALIHWFERWRARALSSLSLGLALGGIFVPVIAWSLAAFGWRATAFASGVAYILVGLPLAWVIRRRPEDHGETIDGAPQLLAQESTSSGKTETTRDFTAREALRTPAFWLISLGHGFALLVVHAVNVHAITYMKEGLG